MHKPTSPPALSAPAAAAWRWQGCAESQAARPSGRRLGSAFGMVPGRPPAGPRAGHRHGEGRFDSAAFDAEITTTPDRLLSCMAGFYDNEAQARQALLQLRQAEGLLPAQSMLLSPKDAGRLRFARLSRRWANDRGDEGARPISGAWVAAVGGALLAILAALAMLWTGARESDTSQAVLLLTSLGLGGLLGAGVFALSVQARRTHRFDDKVRAQLALGCWALVTHRVPWPQQAGVVKLLRSTSLCWCAEAPHVHRL